MRQVLLGFSTVTGLFT